MNTLRKMALLLLLSPVGGFAQTSVTIPNVFTPDNDGVNDMFRISTAGYDAMTCSILNRHGEIVYRFYGLNGSWDAFTHAGVKVTAGTYFVFLELTLPDGSTETRQGTLQVQY
ncbi:MAG: gliding motility-associated C-terminal domain-containing protein [Bacteroidetes bacterium]|nr:gliding motility-associated C-terminal domain-containing protein [Bacteroidota bacterium]